MTRNFALLLLFARAFAKRLFSLVLLACRPDLATAMLQPLANPHLPPHLREVCDILARGLLRLRSRAAEEATRETADQGERLLHFPAPERRHANPTRRRPA